jgi:hypothetical protein
MKKLFLPLVFVLCNPVLAGTISYDALKNHAFGAIRSVEVCAGPHIGEGLGEHRLIRAYIYGSDMVFIDNVLMKKSGLEAVAGVSFAELNDDHAEYSIEHVRCESKGEFLEIIGFVNGSGHDEGKDKTKFEFKIILNPEDGKYEFKKL